MIKDFRDFLMRGNLVELAVAFVMGLAFAALVTSFVNDLTFTINDAVFRDGAFITAAIAFVTTAAAIFFFVVKPMEVITARIAKDKEEAPSDEERRHQELLEAIRGIGV